MLAHPGNPSPHHKEALVYDWESVFRIYYRLAVIALALATLIAGAIGWAIGRWMR